MNYFSRDQAALPQDVDNLQACLTWAFTRSLEGLRGISKDHPGAYRKIDDEGAMLFEALAKPQKECTGPAQAVASITIFCLRELIDELAQKEDPRRALSVLNSLNEEAVSYLFALVIQIMRLSSSPSESVSNKSRELLKSLGAEGCATWLNVATADNFPGVARQLADNDQNLRNIVFPA